MLDHAIQQGLKPLFTRAARVLVRMGVGADALSLAGFAIGIGAAGFAMQDALLEPYGGEILGLSVGATTGLTGAWALGSLIGFMLSGRALACGWDPLRLAGGGLVIGINAFLLVLFAGPFAAPLMLYAGALGIGVGLGLFSVGTLMEAMSLAKTETAGLALGAWGAVQATSRWTAFSASADAAPRAGQGQLTLRTQRTAVNHVHRLDGSIHVNSLR